MNNVAAICKDHARMTAGMQEFTRMNGISCLKKIEWCASHLSSAPKQGADVPESWDRFIRAVVLQHGDWSIVGARDVEALTSAGGSRDHA